MLNIQSKQFNSAQTSFGYKYTVDSKKLQSFMDALPCNNREYVNENIPTRIANILNKFTKNSNSDEEIKIISFNIFQKGGQRGLGIKALLKDKPISSKALYDNRLQSMTTPYDIEPLLESALKSDKFTKAIAP